MGQFAHPTTEEIIKRCSDPNYVSFIAMYDRIGLMGWMTQVEFTWFRPDTPKNDSFHLTIMKWPEEGPLMWAILRIPRAYEEGARKLLWQHGLKVGGDRDPGHLYVAAVIDHTGVHKFPIEGDNVFFLENHSDGAEHVAYTNEKEKLKAAHEAEIEIVMRFRAEHEEWLKVPENYAVAKAYWGEHRDVYPEGEDPPPPTRRF